MESTTLSHSLFPPLDDKVEGRDVISPDLRLNFDKLRSFLAPPQESTHQQLTVFKSNGDRKKRQTLDESEYNSKSPNKKRIVTEEPKHINTRETDRISCEDPVIYQQRVQLAAQTYDVIQSEIALMHNGIRELEALLEASSEDNCSLNTAIVSDVDSEAFLSETCHDANLAFEERCTSGNT